VPIADIAELVPWRVHALPSSPWASTWAFNPTIVRIPDNAAHAHAGAWLVNMRCANYHLPGSGAQANSTGSTSGAAKRIENRNLLLVMDPETWAPVEKIELRDRVPPYRRSAAHVLGYEDLRLAYTRADGLVATATTMQCSSEETLEIAVLQIDGDFAISSVQPLRGEWSGRHQKNWMPYVGDDEAELRLLYSVEEGGVHDRGGRVFPSHGKKYRNTIAVPVPSPQGKRPGRVAHAQPTNFQHGACSVQIMGGRSAIARPRSTQLSLRGGTQLVSIGNDRYLGLAHGAQITPERKYYWHHVVIVNGSGELEARSRPIKLSPQHGIEFAAGLAFGGGHRAIVTFGIDDDFAVLAETTVGALVDLALAGDHFV
jgi:hypothetical protein